MRSTKSTGLSILDGLTRDRVLVTLTNDQGFEGVLWAVDESGLLLKPSAAQPLLFYPDGETPKDVDRGDVFVPTDRVLFVQLLGPEAMG